MASVEAKVKINHKFSIGEHGVRRREDSRLYVTLPTRIDGNAIDELQHLFERTKGVTERVGRERSVVRFCADDNAAEKLLQGKHPLFSNIEVAAPIYMPSGERNWLIILGENSDKRHVGKTRETIIQETAQENYPKREKAAVDILSDALRQEDPKVTIQTHMSEDVREWLTENWGKSFGRSSEEIKELERQLQDHEQYGPWLSVVRYDNKVVAASMLEMLKFKTETGESIRVAENTEWKSDTNGAGKLSVIATNIQAFAAGVHYIFAECNTDSTAGYVANVVGMERPPFIQGGDGSSLVIPQALRDHVTIDGEIRTLGYWHVSGFGQNRHYPPERLSEMLAVINA